MGTVYEAEQPGLGRRVALKVLFPHVATQPDALERLRREAQALALLQHPHSVTVYELISDGPVKAIAMELVDGEGADHRIQRAGKRPFSEVAIVATQVLSVLEAAHALGIIHRDLKPANLMFDRTKSDPFVRVVDFGLAHLQSPSVPAPRLTAEGQAPGTAEYMAPEQVRGEVADARSDLYSLACVLFELLTGSAPFESFSVVNVLTAHLFRDPPSLEERGVLDVPRAWQAVLRRALSKPPDARFTSALEMRRAFEAAMTSDGRERAERAVPEFSPPPFVIADAGAPPVALSCEACTTELVEQLKTAIAGVGATETQDVSRAGAVVVAGRGSLERTRALVLQAPGRPVLLCGPADDLSLMTQAIDAGAFDYLSEPLEFSELGRRVVRALAVGWRPDDVAPR